MPKIGAYVSSQGDPSQTDTDLSGTLRSSTGAQTSQTDESTGYLSLIGSCLMYPVWVNITACGTLLEQASKFNEPETSQVTGTTNNTSAPQSDLSRRSSQASKQSFFSEKDWLSRSQSPESGAGGWRSSYDEDTSKASFAARAKRRLSSGYNSTKKTLKSIGKDKVEEPSFASTCGSALWTGASYVGTALTYAPSIAKAVGVAYWNAAWSCWPGTAQTNTGKTGTGQTLTEKSVGTEESFVPSDDGWYTGTGITKDTKAPASMRDYSSLAPGNTPFESEAPLSVKASEAKSQADSLVHASLLHAALDKSRAESVCGGEFRRGMDWGFKMERRSYKPIPYVAEGSEDFPSVPPSQSVSRNPFSKKFRGSVRR